MSDRKLELVRRIGLLRETQNEFLKREKDKDIALFLAKWIKEIEENPIFEK